MIQVELRITKVGANYAQSFCWYSVTDAFLSGSKLSLAIYREPTAKPRSYKRQIVFEGVFQVRKIGYGLYLYNFAKNGLE